MAVLAEPAPFAVTFGYMNVAYNNRRKDSSVRCEDTVAVMQPAVSILERRVARAIVNAGTSYKWVHFPRTAEEKAAVKEELLRFGPLPGGIGCFDGSFVASRSEQKAPF
ncbi:hypothetical protein MRX96_015057 [Rhipicephalus microplus]